MRPHVLVVEDDFATREALRKILEAEGCTVDLAIDGEKAVGCLARRGFDVVVLDLALPKLSGTDVMEYIASTNPAQLSSIVVVTGLEVQEIRKLFPAIRETLSKPVMPTRLIASVRRCLGATAHPNGLSGISVA
ncbi:MAG: two-component system, OmpR family, alkaline phosphatase synthesis response regulator PhoP [Acidobacteriota bacterium]|jgi:DNA-binding response OmpR family regulator|nr:two-component system, OmpR family, alkaline phosphatase synthesis response regulator PhoP [Acidobacteriota bacterium]